MSDPIKIHRRKFVTVRVTQQEKEKFEEKAKKAEKDVSTYVREQILAESSELESSVV